MDDWGLIAAGLAAALLVAGLVAWWAWRRRAAPSGQAGEAPGAGDRVRLGLAATRERLLGQLDAVFGRGPRPVDVMLGELEEALLAADVGVRTSTALLAPLRDRLAADPTAGAARDAIAGALRGVLAAPPGPEPTVCPWVILVTGVNGVGKTTTIGKLAALHRAAGRRVLVIAGDTFRAAAIDQLAVWAERTGCELVRHAPGGDPSAVVFDGLKAAQARGVDVVLIDTAGRLHTRAPLMEELGKVARVVARTIPGAPHETLLVVDATTGQNAVSQARLFLEAVPLSGVVVTKLDGTARGGVVVAIRQELGLPIRYIGVGEGVGDLRSFDADEFVRALLAG